MSASVLYQPPAELREAGVVESGEEGVYRLTPRGRELLKAFKPLDPRPTGGPTWRSP